MLGSSCVNVNFVFSEKGRVFPDNSEEPIALLNGNLHCCICYFA